MYTHATAATTTAGTWRDTSNNVNPPPPSPNLCPLVSRLSADVAAGLTRALSQLGELADSGRLDGQIMQALCDEITAARRLGMIGQQIARLATGQVQPDSERVLVCELAQSILARRQAANPNFVAVRADFDRLPTRGDPSLFSVMIEAALEWGAEHASGSMEFAITGTHQGRTANMVLSFDLATPVGHEAMDTIHWHLAFFAAQTLGALIRRRTMGLQVILTIALPAAEPQSASQVLPKSRQVAGCQVLVVAPERDLRNKVRLAIRGLDLMVDYVSSVDAAVRYCEDGAPEAVVYDGAIGHGRADDLRLALGNTMRDLPFIEITGQAGAPRHTPNRRGESSVALSHLQHDLPSALATELARSL